MIDSVDLWKRKKRNPYYGQKNIVEIRDYYVDLGLDPGIKCRLMPSPQQCESYGNREAMSYGKSQVVKQVNVEMLHSLQL